MGLTDCVQCQSDLTWEVLLPTWEALVPWDRPQLRLLVLGAEKPGCWERLASWADQPGVSVVAVSGDFLDVDTPRRQYRDREIEFRCHAFGWPQGAPYDAVVSLWPEEFVDFEWLAQCKPDAVLGVPIQPVQSPWRWTLLGLQLAGGLIDGPPVALVPWPGHGHDWVWQTSPTDPVLTVREEMEGYWVQLPPAPATPQPARPGGAVVMRWVVGTARGGTAHLTAVGPTRGIAWQAACGERFNPGLDAERDHLRLCRACLPAYLASRRSLDCSSAWGASA